MKIEEIRKLFYLNEVMYTIHALERMKDRSITKYEVVEAVDNGEIIENYFLDGNENGWLIVGETLTGKVLHVVIIKADLDTLLVTVYQPNIDLWSDNFRRRKRYEV